MSLFLKIEQSFSANYKVNRFAREMGVSRVTARGHLITFWLNVLAQRPDGILDGWGCDEISDAMEWEGDPIALCAHLESTRIITMCNALPTVTCNAVTKQYEIEDWPYRDALEIQGAIRAAGRARVAKYREKQKALKRSETAQTSDIIKEEQIGNALHDVTCNTVTQCNALRKRIEVEEEREIELEIHVGMLSKKDTDVIKVWSVYENHHKNAKLDEKRKKLIRQRLGEGWSVQQLQQAIDGCHVSPHHCGQNATKTVYQSLELIFRDTEHIENFIQHTEATETPTSDAQLDTYYRGLLSSKIETEGLQ